MKLDVKFHLCHNTVSALTMTQTRLKWKPPVSAPRLRVPAALLSATSACVLALFSTNKPYTYVTWRNNGPIAIVKI